MRDTHGGKTVKRILLVGMCLMIAANTVFAKEPANEEMPAAFLALQGKKKVLTTKQAKKIRGQGGVLDIALSAVTAVAKVDRALLRQERAANRDYQAVYLQQGGGGQVAELAQPEVVVIRADNSILAAKPHETAPVAINSKAYDFGHKVGKALATARDIGNNARSFIIASGK